MTTKFKKRYVLGEGYPYVTGLGRPDCPYTDVRLWEEQKASKSIEIDWPEELWSEDLPPYRLVLELIDE